MIIASALARSLVAQMELTVEVTTKRHAEGGVLRVALCPSAAAFDTEEGCVLRTVEVKGPTVRVVFPGVARGSYGIKVFHDVNSNGRMDTNVIGIPKEPYGFSNDVMGLFGPPSFEEAAFKIGEGTTALQRIRLH